MSHPTRTAARSLARLAQGQGGYFTAKQARSVGYEYPLLVYHVSTGGFERVDHGLYRLSNLPRSEHDDFTRLSLWSRNRDDEPQAVVSHDSALFLHELSELLPSEIHLTVPRGFRKRPPAGCVLHTAQLQDEDLEEREGFRVTTPLRTLLDAAAGGVSREQLDKAVADAVSRGLVRRTKLEAAGEGLDRLKTALARVDVGRPRRRK